MKLSNKLKAGLCNTINVAKTCLIRFSVLSHKAKQKTASYAGVVLKAYRKRYQTMI